MSKTHRNDPTEAKGYWRWWIAVILLIIVVALSACQQSPIYVPKEVKIPVGIKCKVELPLEPEWNINKISKDAPLAEKLKVVLADLELSKGYIIQLRAAARACS